MATAAIICEYNPFHNGHAKQLQQIRQMFGTDTTIVCLMSGNFVQRGEPAIFDKMVRASAALAAGANLILELPVTCCLSSAEGFAAGAVEILHRLGGIDYLCFGSETGKLEPLQKLASILLTTSFEQELRFQLKKHVSYATARSLALQELCPEGTQLIRPNDILAVEYCKALQRCHSTIKPVTFLRQGDYHAKEPQQDNPSASSLRSCLEKEDWQAYIPAEAASIYEHAIQYRLQYGQRAMLAVLGSMKQADLEALPYGAEGLWRRFGRACQTETSIPDLIDAVKTKRYARSRISRMTMCAYLGLSQTQMEQPIAYVRILGFDFAGRRVLRVMQDEGQLPLLSGSERSKLPYFELEQRCQRLFALFEDPAAETSGHFENRTILVQRP